MPNGPGGSNHQFQKPASNCRFGIGSDYIDTVRLYIHAVHYLRNVHRSIFRQQPVQHAFVRRVHVLDQHKGHARVRRQRFEKSCESFQATRRRADANDRKRLRRGGLSSLSGERRFGRRRIRRASFLILFRRSGQNFLVGRPCPFLQQ